jgi:hypothetical protein
LVITPFVGSLNQALEMLDGMAERIAAIPGVKIPSLDPDALETGVQRGIALINQLKATLEQTGEIQVETPDVSKVGKSIDMMATQAEVAKATLDRVFKTIISDINGDRIDMTSFRDAGREIKNVMDGIRNALTATLDGADIPDGLKQQIREVLEGLLAEMEGFQTALTEVKGLTLPNLDTSGVQAASIQVEVAANSLKQALGSLGDVHVGEPDISKVAGMQERLDKIGDQCAVAVAGIRDALTNGE